MENYMDYHDSMFDFMISYWKIKSNNMPVNHFHSSYEFYYLLSGERRFFIKDKAVSITPGELILIHPNVLHKTIDSAISQYERLVINFPPDLFADYGVSIALNFEYTVLNVSPKEHENIQNYVETILHELHEKSTGYKLALQGLFFVLMSTVFRLAETKNQPKQPHVDSAQLRLSEISKYINQNHSKNITLPALADRFFLSEYYLCRAFKKFTGFSIVDYINTVRTMEAKKLIESTSEKINVIYKKVGFNSLTNFNRVFKEITGNPPRYYRKLKNPHK